MQHESAQKIQPSLVAVALLWPWLLENVRPCLYPSNPLRYLAKGRSDGRGGVPVCLGQAPRGTVSLALDALRGTVCCLHAPNLVGGLLWPPGLGPHNRFSLLSESDTVVAKGDTWSFSQLVIKKASLINVSDNYLSSNGWTLRCNNFCQHGGADDGKGYGACAGC